MAKYIPSPWNWVREQVELYESSGGTKGITLRDTGLPVVLVTHWGNKTGAIRKTPLMRVKDGDKYILIGSQGGAPKDPAWAHNLRVNPHSFVIRPSYARCACVRSRTRRKELVSGS
jgi:deazaflavin-dependent oxidoreductase (nitroreductase family)